SGGQEEHALIQECDARTQGILHRPLHSKSQLTLAAGDVGSANSAVDLVKHSFDPGGRVRNWEAHLNPPSYKTESWQYADGTNDAGYIERLVPRSLVENGSHSATQSWANRYFDVIVFQRDESVFP